MFAGIWPLTKLILRRDRIKLPIWIVSIVVTLLYMLPILKETYGDAASLTTLYEAFKTNAAGLLLTGFLDEPSFGALVTIETLLWWGLAVAFMNAFLVVRHTRQNEEMGAQELILSGRTHRGTSLIAVLIVAFLANALIAVGLGFGMHTLCADITVEGSWLYGLGMGLFGFVWAAIAAVVVQLFQSTRSSSGFMAVLVGATFLARGIGDFTGKVGADGLLQPAWLSYLSPFGWMQALRSITFPEWWPLLIPIAFVLVVIPLAFVLLMHRDIGAGLLPSRKGRARASRLLRTPVGLTWYLQKNIFIGWLIGSLALIVTVGVLVPQMSHVYETTETTRLLIKSMGGTGAMIPTFLSVMLAIATVMVLAYVVQAMGRLRSEESSGHLESLLSTKLTRTKWLVLHTATVALCGAFMLVACGAALAICVNLCSDFSVDILSYGLAGLSYWPLLLVFIGAYVLMFGVLPRIAGLVVWVYFGWVAFMSWLGPLLNLDEWVMNTSIMRHFAVAPANDITVAPLAWCLLAAVVFGLLGALAWHRRNLVGQ
jgi:ABC-2 type transport system permease protein